MRTVSLVCRLLAYFATSLELASLHDRQELRAILQQLLGILIRFRG